MGGGYAKIANPNGEESVGDEDLYREVSYDNQQGPQQRRSNAGNSAGSESSSSAGSGGAEAGGGEDDEETTPRTENEEIAKQLRERDEEDNRSRTSSGAARKPGNGKASKYANMNIKWADQLADGPALAEPFYSDKLHYSVLYS